MTAQPLSSAEMDAINEMLSPNDSAAKNARTESHVQRRSRGRHIVYSRPQGPAPRRAAVISKPRGVHAGVAAADAQPVRDYEGGLPEDWRPTYRVSKSMAAAEKLPPAVGLMGWCADDVTARAGRAWAPAYDWRTT